MNQYWALLQQNDHGQGPFSAGLRGDIQFEERGVDIRNLEGREKRSLPVALIRRRHPWTNAKSKSVWATDFQEKYRLITRRRNKTSEGLQATYISKRPAPPARLSISGSAGSVEFTLPKSPLQYLLWPGPSITWARGVRGTPSSLSNYPQRSASATNFGASSRCELDPFQAPRSEVVPPLRFQGDPFQLRINRRPSAFSLHTQTLRPVTVNFLISRPSEIDLDNLPKLDSPPPPTRTQRASPRFDLADV